MDDQAHQHSDTHLHGRAAFANEIADIVEQRIYAKIAKWLFINVGGLVGALAIGIGAYYSLDSRINHTQSTDILIKEQVQALQVDNISIRANLISELRDVKQEISEINRFLRDQGNGVRK